MNRSLPLPALFAALADPTRFRLVRILLERDLCVGALARELGVSAPAVSQHMRKLKECGLVSGRKRGYWTHYAVDRAVLREARRELERLAEVRPGAGAGCPGGGACQACCCATGCAGGGGPGCGCPAKPGKEGNR